MEQTSLTDLRAFGMMIVESRYDDQRGYWLHAVVRGEDKPVRRMWKALEGVGRR